MRALVGPERSLPGEWLGVSEVAQLLGLSRQRVDQLRREQRLPSTRTPHGWLYNRAEVVAWQRSRWPVLIGKLTTERVNGMTDVSQTPRSSYGPGEAGPPPDEHKASWAPGLNADQLPMVDELEFNAADLATGANLAHAVIVAQAWQARARAEGKAGKVTYPEAFAADFAGGVDQEPPKHEQHEEKTEPKEQKHH